MFPRFLFLVFYLIISESYAKVATSKQGKKVQRLVYFSQNFQIQLSTNRSREGSLILNRSFQQIIGLRPNF